MNQYEQRIEFFERSNETKQKIMQSENDRLKLEMEFNKLANSDQVVHKSKAAKLKAYYTKLCEDEAKSTKRNQHLLNELKRVDSQFQQLESKLQRLTNLKKECEIYIRTAYPNWTNKNGLFRNDEVNLKDSFQTSNNIDQPNTARSPTRPLNDSALDVLLNSLILNEKVTQPYETNKSNSILNNLVLNVNNQLESRNEPKKQNEFIEKLVQSSIINNVGKREGLVETFQQQMTLTAQLNNNDNLLKEYENEIQRQDAANIFNMSASLNLNQVTNETKYESKEAQKIPEENHKIDDQKFENDESSFSEKVQKNSLRQELNLGALYYLMDFIELEMDQTIHPEKFYRHVEPHYKHKLEIIKLAQRREPLNDISSADVSMVILDQLPSVIKNHTQNKCVLTPDLLSLSMTDINEEVIKICLENPNDKELWSRLLKHWLYLKRNAMFDSKSLAIKFAPALLGVYQIGTEKAIQIVEKVLNSQGYGINQIETLSESKSLGADTTINQELMLASNSKLKESSVYQDFINNSNPNTWTLKQAKQKQNNEEEDENDEIDALIAPKSLQSSGSGLIKQISSANIIKSPRSGAGGDYEFDFSQGSMSDSYKKAPSSLKQLNSLRSSKDKKLPAHLRDLESSDDSESLNEIKSKINQQSQKSDLDYDFYN